MNQPTYNRHETNAARQRSGGFVLPGDARIALDACLCMEFVTQ